MILPIVAYGDPVLRKKGATVTQNDEGLTVLIANMWETMYASRGVGLAAPQVGKPINLFLVDTTSFEDEDYPSLKKVFINAEILEESGDLWEFEEGCLSIPLIRENVKRKSIIKIKYQDEHFNWHEEQYDGIAARVMQHEYDHVKGVLFVDYLSELKKRLLKNKLINVSKGGVQVDYKMRFPAIR
ncbi:MAG: peptide deformylase [Bacteroidetes bacterium]|nr:MAG: peptide deformylase [Bacteroidota bacterium]